MLKKSVLLSLTVCFLIILIGCSNDDKYIEYQIGDIVIKDGIIYEYNDVSIKSGNVFSFETADDDVLYHDYYYYDMSNPNQGPIVPFPKDDYSVEYTDMVVKATSLSYYFGPKYFETHELRRRTWPYVEGRKGWMGFMIKGYTDKVKEDIVIPEYIHGNYVSGVAYKGLKNAPIKSLVFKGRAGYILPFGLDGLPNLETLTLPEYPLLFSMSIANCHSLTEVNRVYSLNDASFYNLPNLRRIHYSNMFQSPSYTLTSRVVKISFGVIFGLYRSSFYLCPSIEEITIGKVAYDLFNISEVDNVIYCELYGEKRILYVKNNYHINLNELQNDFWMANEEENYLYVPFLNDGYNKKGTISYEEDYFIKEVDGQVYYRPWVYDSRAHYLLTAERFFVFKTEYHV